MEKIKCSAVILAGGKSSRMNYNPKGLLKYKDKSFIKRTIEALENFDEIIISCNDERIKKEFKGYKIVEDEIKEIGPLGGLYTVLKEINNEKAIVVSCDMPLLEKEILENMGRIDFKEECLISRIEGKIEPFCSVYKKNITGKLEKNIKNGEYRFINFIKLLNVHYIDIKNKNNFTNINTIEEYNKLIEED